MGPNLMQLSMLQGEILLNTKTYSLKILHITWKNIGSRLKNSVFHQINSHVVVLKLSLKWYIVWYKKNLRFPNPNNVRHDSF